MNFRVLPFDENRVINFDTVQEFLSIEDGGLGKDGIIKDTKYLIVFKYVNMYSEPFEFKTKEERDGYFNSLLIVLSE